MPIIHFSKETTTILPKSHINGVRGGRIVDTPDKETVSVEDGNNIEIQKDMR